MGTLLFFLVLGAVGWYAGGPDLALIFCIVFGLLWGIGSLSNRHMHQQTSVADRERHQQDGFGHIYYERNGQTIHESDGCAACMQNRAEQLRRQGIEVEHLPGRHNSGDLV